MKNTDPQDIWASSGINVATDRRYEWLLSYADAAGLHGHGMDTPVRTVSVPHTPKSR